MSDAPQGPDWWQASDDKWYPPPRPQMPGDAPAAVAPGYAPPGSVPGAPPLGPPAGTPSGGYPQGGFPPAGPPGAPGYPSGPGGPGGPGVPGPYGPSPYGGVPGQQPPANRTPLFIGLGVVVAIAVIGLIVALSGGDDDDGGETSDRPQVTVPEVTTVDPGGTTETTDAGSVGDASEGTTEVQGLELVDSGWSVAEDDSIVEGSYGIIIENKGEELVTNFNVEVAIYDLNDTVVGTNSHMVAKLAPGETLGIGYDINDDVSNGISRLDVAFEEGYGDSVPEGAFTVSEVATTTDEYGTETTFTVASSYTVDLDSPYAYVIYRDAAGKIIGGTYGLVDMVPAGGRANGTLTSYEPVPGVETAEVWVDQGFF